MLSWLFQSWNIPFLIALGSGLGLSVLSLLGAADFDLDLPGFDVALPADAPPMLLLQALLTSFGVLGLLTAGLLFDLFGASGVAATLPGLAVGGAGSLAFTAATGRALQRLLPASTVTPGGHVGQVGTAITSVTARAGQVRLDGTPPKILQVRLMADHPDQPRGAELILVAYDAATRTYLVAPAPPVG